MPGQPSGHVAEGTPAPGLGRFLTKWLAIYNDVGTLDLQSPTRFARDEDKRSQYERALLAYGGAKRRARKRKPSKPRGFEGYL